MTRRQGLLLVLSLAATLGCAVSPPGPPSPGDVVAPAPESQGTLLVYTATEAVYDGGIYYYPHVAYVILGPDGRVIRHVANRLGENDEDPVPVRLSPGKYGVRTEVRGGRSVEFVVVIEAGRLTRLRVEELLAAGG